MNLQDIPLIPAANPAQLPFLLRLLDDDSAVVRKAVAGELSAFGPQLDALLDQVDPYPGESDREFIRHILLDFKRSELRARWRDWYAVEGDLEKLEAAYSTLSVYMNGAGAGVELKRSLDQLAVEFAGFRPEFSQNALPPVIEESAPGTAALALADFLFKHAGLRGAIATYNNPENSDLLHCIRNKEGLPISLVCIYMLVGKRLGIDIAACNWPGHFLARVRLGDSYAVVDCFREGTCVPEEAFLKMQGPSQSAAEVVLKQSADADTIVLRLLNNLAHAYQSQDDDVSRALMIDLRHDLERHLVSVYGR